MRRYMKVLASTSALSVQMVISNAAFADIQRLPENGATAPRGPAPCPVGAYCSSSPDGIYSGGGGSGGSNSFPENEATAPRPAPPPRTEQQKAADRAKCDADKAQSRTDITEVYRSNGAICSATNNTTFGYIHQQWLEIIGEITGGRVMSCRQYNDAAFREAMRITDARHDQCMERANKD